MTINFSSFAFSLIIAKTNFMFSELATDVPPNFNTFIFSYLYLMMGIVANFHRYYLVAVFYFFKRGIYFITDRLFFFRKKNNR